MHDSLHGLLLSHVLRVEQRGLFLKICLCVWSFRHVYCSQNSQSDRTKLLIRQSLRRLFAQVSSFRFSWRLSWKKPSLHSLYLRESIRYETLFSFWHPWLLETLTFPADRSLHATGRTAVRNVPASRGEVLPFPWDIRNPKIQKEFRKIPKVISLNLNDLKTIGNA